MPTVATSEALTVNPSLTYLGTEDMPHAPGSYCWFSVKNFRWNPNEGEGDDAALGLLLADTHYQFRYPVLRGVEDPRPGQHGPYRWTHIAPQAFSLVSAPEVIDALRSWIDAWVCEPPQPRDDIAHSHVDRLLPRIESATSRFQLGDLSPEAKLPTMQFLQPWYEAVLVNHVVGEVALVNAHAD